MATPEASNVTLQEFQVIVQQAGLDLNQEEMEHLLPIYQQFAEQVHMLHAPELPLDLPATKFTAEWSD